MTTQIIEDKPTLYVALKTPYLTQSFDEMVLESGEEYANMQANRYGHERVNLSGVRMLHSPSGKTVVLRSRGVWGFSESESRIIVPDMYIMGAVKEAAEVVQEAMNDGLFIARFSIFYGRASDYTSKLPEEAGYSLDIPKSVETVKALLTDDSCLEAIASRNSSKIRESLDVLNRSFERPIIATPHLERALSLPQARRVLK